MKKIFISILVILLVFLFLIFLKHYGPQKEILKSMRDFNALMEVKNIKIRGWDGEIARWEIEAADAKMKEKDFVILDKIRRGCIYNDYNEKIMDRITADKADVRLHRKQVELYGVQGIFKSNKFSNTNPINVKAGVLSYNEHDKKITFYDDIEISQGKRYIKSNLCNVEDNSEKIRFYNGFKFNAENISVNGQELIFNMKEDYIKMRGKLNVLQSNISGIGDANTSSFKLKCDELTFYKKEGKESMNFNGNIVLVHQGNTIIAKEGSYWGYKKQLLLENEISIAFGNPENIISKENSVISKNSVLKGVRMFVDTERKNMNIAGPLEFSQPGLSIVAQNGFYDFKLNKLYLSDLVEIHHNKKILKCNKVEINMVSGTFEAIGQIYTKITI
ncbi:MAG: hypothetical protein A2Y40_03510 [Candidatus Margulisbacteria bacterium GWF2_35_9]|nr:MAG: hypothetical protein A2Y40_03510 [Candidatus Margulisbacteria bacterium GWF2_35_9]